MDGRLLAPKSHIAVCTVEGYAGSAYRGLELHMGEKTKRELLRRAVELVGREELARRLNAPETLLDAWLRGLATMPDRKLFPLAAVLEQAGDPNT